MGIFGFGKKKQSSAPQPVQKPEPVPTNFPSNQEYIVVNGIWQVNPNYDPDAPKAKPATFDNGVYTEPVEKFLERNDDAKLFKLTGKAEEYALPQVGNRCKIEYDDEKEKYAVLCGDFVIGYLPSSAVSYAEKLGTDPNCMVSIISDIDYDMEKDRDIISVYVAG
jgi:hypothetical protein